MSADGPIRMIHLTSEQWTEHFVHRAQCPDLLCGHLAHRYMRDIAAGWVFVEGVQVIESDAAMTTANVIVLHLPKRSGMGRPRWAYCGERAQSKSDIPEWSETRICSDCLRKVCTYLSPTYEST